MRRPITWDDLWIQLAATVAQRSKDPSTQVGAVIVSPDQRRIAVGYNGFSYGIEDTPERWERPTKYKYVAHAEMNAILNAGLGGFSVAGWTLYVTIPVCADCAKYVIQAGVRKVIYQHGPTAGSQIDYGHASSLFSEAGIEVRPWHPEAP